MAAHVLSGGHCAGTGGQGLGRLSPGPSDPGVHLEGPQSEERNGFY